MERLSIEWRQLWSAARDRDPDELLAEWPRLSLERQAALARAPLDVPPARGAGATQPPGSCSVQGAAGRGCWACGGVVALTPPGRC